MIINTRSSIFIFHCLHFDRVSSPYFNKPPIYLPVMSTVARWRLLILLEGQMWKTITWTTANRHEHTQVLICVHRHTQPQHTHVHINTRAHTRTDVDGFVCICSLCTLALSVSLCQEVSLWSSAQLSSKVTMDWNSVGTNCTYEA